MSKIAKILKNGGDAAQEIRDIIDSWDGFTYINIEEKFKQVKERVVVQKLLKPGEYEKLSKFERKRIRKMNREYTMLWVLELPLPTERSIRALLGLPPKKGFQVNFTSDEESDEDWTPQKISKKRSKDEVKLTLRDFAKRRNWVEKKLMTGLTKKENVPVKKSGPKKQANPKKEDVKVEPRYPKREVVRVNYEDEGADEDDYLFCDKCNKLHFGDCPVHGKMSQVPDTKIKMNLMGRAKLTCPKGLRVAKSSIRCGGEGVWTNVTIPEGIVFGPYEGEKIHRQDVQKLKHVYEGGCAWEIYKKGKLSHYIDGKDRRCSNWLSYVNCARFEQEQNLIAFQYKQAIYYKTFKKIKKNSELLVWYGKQYAQELGITTTNETPQMKIKELKMNPELLLRTDLFICKLCEEIFGNKEAYENHIKRKHQSGKKKHSCNLCDYSVDYESHLKRHQLTHSKKKEFVCRLCGKCFGQKSHLNLHHKSVHLKESHPCEICNKSFSRKGNLQTHIRTVHEKQKAFVCIECGKSFGHSNSLTTHQRIHTGEKLYDCKFCSKSFSDPSGLKSHEIMMHTKKFPHNCSICKKGFMCPSALKNHLRSHN